MSTRPSRATSSATVRVTIAPAKQDSHESPEATTHDATASEESIRMAAYFLAERRGFETGHELDDWLAAEQALKAADADGHASGSSAG